MELGRPPPQRFIGIVRERRQASEARERIGIAGSRCAQKIFGLIFQLIEIRALG